MQPRFPTGRQPSPPRQKTRRRRSRPHSATPFRKRRTRRATPSSWASQSGDGGLPDWLSFDPGTLTFSGYPVASDYPAELSVQVVADDDGEDRQSAVTAFTLTVEPALLRPQGENWPYFDRPVGERTVPENSPAGTRVGAPIRATDADGDTLLYHADSDAFEIDPAPAS